jgi:SLT domain-containing protein
MPSKGLMQVIDPTFHAYHVDGTSWDIYNPVANITAACNYAAHRYGSIDNVYSAY